MQTDVIQFCVGRNSSIRDVIAKMNVSGLGIVLVVDKERRLTGTITDGDVRRAVLAKVGLDQPVTVLLARKAGSRFARSITASVAEDRSTYLSILQQHNVRHLPIVDEAERVVGLVTVDDFVPIQALSLRAVIMAGGSGTRLRPLTEDLPKPMLPVGDRPLMEIIIGQLRDAGIKRVHVTTYHNGDKITDYFGDGKDFGIDIAYVAEDRPLGTAGALGLMEPPQETILVINGDILTQVDFRSMLAFHHEHHADLTVAVRPYEVQVPYGVVESEGASVRRLTEKPCMTFLVNAGIYLMEPTVQGFIPKGERFDMTDLIQALLAVGRPVVTFPIREYWLDIGQHSDYVQAQEHIKEWKRGS